MVVVFFRGTNGYYGTWAIADIENNRLYGTWHFVSDGSNDFADYDIQSSKAVHYGEVNSIYRPF